MQEVEKNDKTVILTVTVTIAAEKDCFFSSEMSHKLSTWTFDTIYEILTHLAYRVNGNKLWYIAQ